MKTFFVHLLLITVLFISLAEAQRWGGWGSRPLSTKQASKTSNGYGVSTQPTTSQKMQKMARGMAIGAWGYVAIILSIVLSGCGVYYFILFYPIVCKKERMYDVMEMTAV